MIKFLSKKLACIVILSFVLLFAGFSANSQGRSDRFGMNPFVVPPSPEVAELTRIGQLSSNLFTGATNIEIPIYTLSKGDVKVPISLVYSNNGVRVTDIPSRVGLGWNLTAGGSVSRVVHDEPDDDTDVLPPVNFEVFNQYLIDYLTNATTYYYDTERDMFSVSAPGLSGKFFIDDTGTPRFVKHNNLKVEVFDGLQGFSITNAEGVIYLFGEDDKIEKTRQIKLSGFEPPYQIQKTTWFLTNIYSPEGYQISFNYSPIYIKTFQGPSQTANLMPIGSSSDCGVCNTSISGISYGQLDYDTFYLSGITTSDGISASFTYESRGDSGGDNRLTNIMIHSGAKQIKKYEFAYFNTGHSGTPMNRKFFLTNIDQLSNDVTPQKLRLATFEYVTPEYMPTVQSLSQDFFGYYNGALNGTFYPSFPGSSYYEFGSTTANRLPAFPASTMGALKKITFATGGYDEYTYEAHTLYQASPTPINKEVCGIRVKSIRSYDPVSNKSNYKYYKYAALSNPNQSSGVGSAGMPYVEGNAISGWCPAPPPAFGESLVNCSNVVVNSSNLQLPPDYNGSAIAYAYVIESDDENFVNGCTEHHFETFTNGDTYAILNQHITYRDFNNPELTGLEYYTHYYSKVGAGLQKVKAVQNNYMITYPGYQVSNFNVRKRYRPSPTTPPDYIAMASGFDVNEYIYICGWIKLTSTETTNYDVNGGSPTAQTTNYTYADFSHTLPTTVTTYNSKAQVVTTNLKYPNDIPSTVNNAMVAAHIVSPVLEKTILIAGTLTSTEQTIWNLFTQGGLKPELLKTSTLDNTPETRLHYYAYDSWGDPLELSQQDGPKVSYIWGYNKKYPIAESKNVGVAGVYLQNFEELSGASSVTTAHTGVKYYSGTYTVNFTRPDSRDYVISYWYRSGSGQWLLKPEQAYITASLVLPTGFDYDDIRIYPKDAAMTSYTYDPLVGMTSSIDAKGLTTYYEYDGFQRLLNVRDKDGNIIKHMEYHYQTP